ncbi:MAG: DUF58 domain-containing protein [Nannocystaceae bacterium]|nr:DUF58 domain-containing protein [bacterium]
MKVDRTALARFAELRLHAPSVATSLQQGDRRSPFLGRGVEFADYREYDPGDDIRLIDWNVYLRLGQVLVRQFNEERSLSIKLCVDVSASMGCGDPRKADRAAEVTAALATIALVHRDPVTLVCFGSDRPPVRAKAVNFDGMAELVHVLERVEPSGRGDAYKQLAGQLGGGRTDRLFLLSDLLCEPEAREQLLRLLAASSLHPVLLHTLSADELEPDLRDVSEIVDAETGETLVLRDGADAAAAYQEGLQRWLEEIAARCKTLGIQYLRLPPQGEGLIGFVEGDLRRAHVVETMAGGNQ